MPYGFRRDASSRSLMPRPLRISCQGGSSLPLSLSQSTAVQILSSKGPDVARLWGSERRLKRMNRVLKQAPIAVAVLGSASLISGTASANSVHDEGYFGGGYSYIGPGPYSQRRLA